MHRAELVAMRIEGAGEVDCLPLEWKGAFERAVFRLAARPRSSMRRGAGERNFRCGTYDEGSRTDMVVLTNSRQCGCNSLVPGMRTDQMACARAALSAAFGFVRERSWTNFGPRLFRRPIAASMVSHARNRTRYLFPHVSHPGTVSRDLCDGPYGGCREFRPAGAVLA